MTFECFSDLNIGEKLSCQSNQLSKLLAFTVNFSPHSFLRLFNQFLGKVGVKPKSQISHAKMNGKSVKILLSK
jgi:hypothetical protein